MSVELLVRVDQRAAMKLGKPSGEWQKVIIKDEDVKGWTEEQRDMVGRLIYKTPNNVPQNIATQCLGIPQYVQWSNSFNPSGVLAVEEVSPAGVLRAVEQNWLFSKKEQEQYLEKKEEKKNEDERKARELLKQPMSLLVKKDPYQKKNPWKPVDPLVPPVDYQFLAELAALAAAECDALNAQHDQEQERKAKEEQERSKQEVAKRQAERAALVVWANQHGSETTKLRLKLGYDSWEESAKKDKEKIREEQANKVATELASHLGMAVVTNEEQDWDNEDQRTHPAQHEMEAQVKAQAFSGVLEVQIDVVNWDEKKDDDGEVVQEKKSEVMLYVMVKTDYGTTGSYLRWKD